ncbi:MAG: efflux RND transporter periplasmic adaptor subunit [Pseudomonadota bacterium]
MFRTAIAAFAVSVSLAFAQDQPPPEVTVANPVVKEIVEDDEFIGRFEAAARVELRARVSGYLEEVSFKDGSLVEAGDVLFQVDRRLFQSALLQAEAQVSTAEASLQFATEQLERAQALIGNGTVPQSVLDERQERFLAATGSLEQARQTLETAEINLGFSEVRAPISGRVDRTLVTPGNLVRADETILTTIVATDPVHFYFDIDERSFLAYSRDAQTRGAPLQEGAGGLEVVLSLSDERYGTFDGALDFSENRLDPNTGTMRVRAVVENPEGVLTPGLFGQVNIPGSLPYRGILLPDAAIVGDQNRQLVMSVDANGNVIPIEVRPGPRLDGYRVIREGLTGEESVVIEGLIRARPGALVTPVMTELPPVADQ